MVRLVKLLASWRPHFSCAQQLLAERMIIIVAYLRTEVVKFIFGGRSSGQNASGNIEMAAEFDQINCIAPFRDTRMSIAVPRMTGTPRRDDISVHLQHRKRYRVRYLEQIV